MSALLAAANLGEEDSKLASVVAALEPSIDTQLRKDLDRLKRSTDAQEWRTPIVWWRFALFMKLFKM